MLVVTVDWMLIFFEKSQKRNEKRTEKDICALLLFLRTYIKIFWSAVSISRISKPVKGKEYNI